MTKKSTPTLTKINIKFKQRDKNVAGVWSIKIVPLKQHKVRVKTIHLREVKSERI